MQTTPYREALKQTLFVLSQSLQHTHTTMMVVLIRGDLKEWTKTVPSGEEHTLDLELCVNSDDPNILSLVDLLQAVNETFMAIKNLNGIEDEELRDLISLF
jgi:hypothetical protein